jgi:hypothetical protein
MRSLKQRVMLVFLFAVSAAFPAAAAELSAQKSSERGVTVAVTPLNVSADAKTWDFKIVLDTHSQDLSDDLLKTAVLLDGTGTRHAPVAWEGAAPGGHHREGVLRFKPVTPQPAAIELRITRPGEPGPRSFRWQLK